MDFKRLTIVVGHYGSGKTEISINYAVYIRQMGKEVEIVDLDVVNPYFRSREVRKELLEKWGIKVVGVEEKYVNADVPVISRTVYGALYSTEKHAVFDVGGDDVGAMPLGQYRHIIYEQDPEVLLVVNVNRPFTKDADSVIKYLKAIEEASKIKVTHLVNNTHMSYETTVDDVLKGLEVVEEVSSKTGIPIKMVTVKRDLVNLLPQIDYPVFPLDLYMKTPWDKM
ncbi:CheY-like chemotaxis protein [Caldanaerobacter subterraneus subsp. tengcongensis MB4]|uniref:CobQ/CobB/MinD/ParA nucleotide binding domain-containing protein n=3 Tax=Caldanaerobacter subterraneus TaxID=911092 RepID=Q8R833_CALS4|nr:hypothetical protein [Caldanaerobacter subterraneus]AAM25355.1 conserved hypothetical protein [Caldanaerobacter subterraneus subsp. tengcongensis MB4]KKC29097.1 hypothetical protein CDSM653_01948 [Caldanaerobacter subterraneus subsp. pacificus DSM 12653]MCS3915040.1 CheY-like chemotaxis protein [Caldanaerobacter subterraneus subsp. tengcongensis MB4]HBT48440.1 hypothetical protein [Caldanaerobacter subterraneus]